LKDRQQVEFAGHEIFSSLDPSHREKLKSLFRPRSFCSNEIIFSKGDPGFGLYLIRSGRVKICVIDRNGSELIFTFMLQGDLLGDLAIFDGKPRSATAIAVTDTDTLYLDRKEFLEYLSVSPQACLDIINMLCQRLRRVSTQLEEISFLDIAGRIARKLMDISTGDNSYMVLQERTLTCSITQEELARVIGASREMVNKVLNSFVDLGIISLKRKKLTILNTQELARIAAYEGET
jgi:CRP/FNR family transcriptional regulator, cyclic AMP receptor protein